MNHNFFEYTHNFTINNCNNKEKKNLFIKNYKIAQFDLRFI